jgi:hypothetical protein
LGGRKIAMSMPTEDTDVLGEDYHEKIRREWNEDPESAHTESGVYGPDGEQKQQSPSRSWLS